MACLLGINGGPKRPEPATLRGCGAVKERQKTRVMAEVLQHRAIASLVLFPQLRLGLRWYHCPVGTVTRYRCVLAVRVAST